MKPKQKFTGELKGKFIPDRPDLWKSRTESLKGQRVCVTIEREKKSRSHSQNRYYWGVVLAIISDETGHTPEEIHEIVRLRFLPMPTDIGGVGFIPGSTAGLDTAGFERLMEDVRRWAAAELNVHIPLPNEVPFEY